MQQDAHPYRSVLYMPGSRPRALEKARGLPADALILDLEDAVAPAEKPNARELVAEAVEAGGYGGRRLLIRINGFDTEWGEDDMARAALAGPDAVLLPKVETPEHVIGAAERLDRLGAPERTRLWAMMETPRGVLNAAAIAAAHPRLEGFVLGTNDLAKDLGAAHTPDRLPLVTSLGALPARRPRRGARLRRRRLQRLPGRRGPARRLRPGPRHGLRRQDADPPRPARDRQRGLRPLARRRRARRDARSPPSRRPQARGEGVAVVDGRIVENLHVVTARRLLARAAAIAALEAAS